MSLEQRLADDMKDAMRAKDELRLSVIRMIRGQILLEKKKGTGIDAVPDETVIALVRGHVKKLNESAETARQAGRDDLVAHAESELAIAKAYLPAELADADLDAMVQAAIAAGAAGGATGPKAMGAVMKATMEQVKGRADGRRVQEAVKRALGL